MSDPIVILHEQSKQLIVQQQRRIDKLESQLAALRDAATEVVHAGRAGFVTANSHWSAGRYEVVAKFITLDDMQRFYKSLAVLTKESEASEATESEVDDE